MNAKKSSSLSGEFSFDFDSFTFEDSFDRDEIQRIQDSLSKTLGVAALITDVKGQPLTQPSNLSLEHKGVLCQEAKGMTDCMHQVATAGALKPGGSLLQPCLDVGFLDGGIGIFLGERHVANCLVGQVLRDDFDEQHLAAYVKKFKVDEDAFRDAVAHMPRMSTTQFQQLVQTFFVVVHQFFQSSSQNYQRQKEAVQSQQRETDLVKRVALFESLFEHMDVSLIIMSLDMVPQFANIACEEILGLADVKSYLGQSWLEIEEPWTELRPDGTLMTMAENPLAKSLQGVETHDVKYMIKRADGSISWVSVQGMPLYNPAGEFIAGAIAFSDITEYKLAERELQDNAKLMQGLVSSVPGAVFQFKLEPDSQRSFPYVSGRWEELFGITKEDALRDADISFGVIHPQDLPGLQDAIIVSAQTLDPWSLEYRVQVAGVTKWIVGKAIPVSQSDGSVLWSGLMMDITASRQAEQERERLQREIIESQRHALDELSTPIIPIMDQIIVMPLIGGIDSLRAKDIMRSLLTGIRENHAKVVILDVTGVPVVDTGVVNYLNKTVQAARLKGARTIITGISDAVAESIVDLGIDWSKIETLRDLQSGLLVALKTMGLKLQR